MIQQETKGNYPAPLAALELMLETCQLPADEALQREAEGMAELFGSPVNAALINVFFLTDRNKRDTGLDKPGVSRSDDQIGRRHRRGIMGSGIAAATLKSEVPVALTDANAEALARGAKQVLEEVAYNRKTQRARICAKTLKLAPLLDRHASRGRDRRLRPGDRSDRRKGRRQEAALSPGWSRCCGPTRSWPPTPRRFRSRGWRRGSSGPSGSAAFTFSIPCGG